jgi:predicted peptidase
MKSCLRLALMVLLLTGCTTEPAEPQVDTVVTRRAAGTHYLTNVLPTGGFIRYTLYVPPGGVDAPGASVPLVLAAHFGGTVTPWLGGDYADLLVMPALSGLGAVVVAPDARTASGWSDADEPGLMWLVKQIRDVYPIDARKVVMTGYSAGGGQTWMVANRNQDFFTAVIPVSARPRSTPNTWTIPVYVIHSRDDEQIPFATVESYVSTQQAAGAPVRLQLLSGISHYQTAAFVPALRDAIPWLRQVWP